jgi:hypothetical protein
VIARIPASTAASALMTAFVQADNFRSMVNGMGIFVMMMSLMVFATAAFIYK